MVVRTGNAENDGLGSADFYTAFLELTVEDV